MKRHDSYNYVQKKIKNNVKNKLTKNETKNNSFAKFIEIAIRMNDKFYEKVIKRRYN